MTNGIDTALLMLWRLALGLIVQERASRFFVRHCPPLSTWRNRMSPDLPDLPPPLFDCLQYAKIKDKTKELTTVCLSTLSTDLQFSLIGEEVSRQCKHIALVYDHDHSFMYEMTAYSIHTTCSWHFFRCWQRTGYSSSESDRLIQREPGKSINIVDVFLVTMMQ